MSGTPNLDLQYLDPSQAQPEVKINDAWNKIDEAVGLGIGIAVSDVSTSPPIVRQARELKFMGATVTHETDDVAVIQIDASSGGGGSGGGGSPIDVTDGITDVTNITKIRFTSGATVTASSGSVADVDISAPGSLTVTDGSTSVANVTDLLFVGATVTSPSAGHATATMSGGGGSNPYNVTPLTHDAGVAPFAANDDFEEANGTAIDTAGTRFSGAAAWSWLNQGASTAIQQRGSLVLTPDNSTPRGCFLLQPVSGSTWSIQCRLSMFNGGSSHYGGLALRESVSGKLIIFTVYSLTQFLVQALTNATTFNSNVFLGGTWQAAGTSDSVPVYLQITFDGTTLSFNQSLTGIPGTFNVLATQAAATFLGAAPTDWGLYVDNSSTARAIFDKFEQTA